MHKYSFILFLSVFLTIYLGTHYYVYVRIAGGLMLPAMARTLLKLAFLAGASSFFISEILIRRTSSPLLRPVSEAGMIWLGVIAIALTVFVARDILSLLIRTPDFRSRSTAVSCLVIALICVFSIINVARGWTIRAITLHVPGLPTQLDGFSIVQLSDVHINSMTPPGTIEKLVSDTKQLSPDLIVITGDLIDADICGFPKLCSSLSALSAPFGIYAVSGNHESYAGMDIFHRACEKIGAQLIDNRSVRLPNGLTLAGISDEMSLSGPAAGPFIRQALASSKQNSSGPTILLSHRPDTFDAAVKEGVQIQLSGHTHAGQIPPMDIITTFFFKYPVGLYHKAGASLYVTTGTGYWGPPMRLFSRSEIVKIILKP